MVNDGSKDGTLQRLIDEYNLVEDLRVPRAKLQSKPVFATYRSLSDERLIVIDKENGGCRADAMNAGLRYARFPLFVAVDADTLLDVDALPRLVRAFQVRPETVGSAGSCGSRTAPRSRPASDRGAHPAPDAREPPDHRVPPRVPRRAYGLVPDRRAADRLRGVRHLPPRGRDRGRWLRPREPWPKTPSSSSACTSSAASVAGRTGSGSSPTRFAGPRRPRRCATLAAQRDRWQRGLLQMLWDYRGMVGSQALRRGGDVRPALLRGLRGARPGDRGGRLPRSDRLAGLRLDTARDGDRLLRGLHRARHRVLVRRAAGRGAGLPALQGLALLRPPCAGGRAREPRLPAVVRAACRVRATWSHLRRTPVSWGEMPRTGFSPASAPSKS